MKFLNRSEELARLDRLADAESGGLAVVYGRRRIGKTRLLVEWCRRRGGVYAVADQSTADVQRRYLAEALAPTFAGFADVEYRDWRGLLTRLAQMSRAAGWHGPVVFDELPYWISTSPEIPSVLQRWVDHEARAAGLVVAVAGSSQRMMQGLALSREAPLFGRAQELFELLPLELPYVADAIGSRSAGRMLEFYTAWGGVPRYWELAAPFGDVIESVEALVLDPSGPLHREPDRLLLEEMPPAGEVRPVLDAIGAGAHRVSEIGARIGRPATSLSRPLERLLELGLVVRELPFGEPPRGSRRSLYRIADPFMRLWFSVVAPRRGELVSGTRAGRVALLNRFWTALVAQTWEQLCRHRLPRAAADSRVAWLGPWKAASRWWRGDAPEWDVVAESIDGDRLLFGEAKLAKGRLPSRRLEAMVADVAARPLPELPARYRRHRVVRALLLPEARRRGATAIDGVELLVLADLL